MTPVLVLVGLPGAGKTSAGRRAARRLGVPFADTDVLIEAKIGETVSEIFERRGEPAFRAIEADVVRDALADFDGVLALGGGAVTTAETRSLLRSSGATVVHLTTTAASALSRIGDATSRPLLRADPAARMATLHRERAPLYDAVATVTVASSGRPIFLIVDDLVTIGTGNLSDPAPR